ncbi:hypothetical protein L6452_17476 [Arctium lappa]|uniref:Uncharacterized protein n=1 Tax=Arctium lappa TaxID=4217 RepID=A0ACB9C3T7_ARCLA|nr:hypothetical protein L6452_17476 [Arctium lappa]
MSSNFSGRSLFQAYFLNLIKMPTNDSKRNTVLSKRDCEIAYMPEIPALEAENLKLKFQNSELKTKTVDLQSKLKKFEKKISTLKTKSTDLMKMCEEKFRIEKPDLERNYNQKLSDLSKKIVQEKKDIELICIKLSKQVSEFEKILISERDIFAKEKQVLEEKFVDLPTQICTLQDLLEKERKVFQEKKISFESEKKTFEKKNVGIFKEISAKNKNMEKDFEQERNFFETEISKLSVLASDILK